MLEIKNLTKVYDTGTVALKDVTCTIPDGSFTVVIGLSGSGKSTMLRCINRLIDPTDGQIIFDGQDITAARGEELRKIRREIDMIFQHFNLVRRSTVLTNVLSGRLGYVNPAMSLFNRFPQEDRDRALEALEQVGLDDKAYTRADALSGGQQQRVGIARALMQRPKMILADEPVASLDPVLAHSIMEYLEKLNQEQGITILCSLHYLDLVQRYSTNVIGLRRGRLVYQGTNEDIRNLTDADFKDIYGEQAVRIGTGSITG
ncbi:MAG: phosphonate ABC transporter ATP-binding protein [Anaerolineae bacterium]